MDELKMSTALVNAILQYLSNQPFNQVAGLIEAIHKEAQAQGATPIAPAEPEAAQ